VLNVLVSFPCPTISVPEKEFTHFVTAAVGHRDVEVTAGKMLRATVASSSDAIRSDAVGPAPCRHEGQWRHIGKSRCKDSPSGSVGNAYIRLHPYTSAIESAQLLISKALSTFVSGVEQHLQKVVHAARS
jgi:hypothetical protein